MGMSKPHDETTQYGRDLAAWLESAKLSQRDLAAELGTSQPTVSYWVRGVHVPSQPTQGAISRLSGGAVPERCAACHRLMEGGEHG